MSTEETIKALANEYYKKLTEKTPMKGIGSHEHIYFTYGVEWAFEKLREGTERVECYLPCEFSESEIYAGTQAGPLPLKAVTLTVVRESEPIKELIDPYKKEFGIDVTSDDDDDNDFQPCDHCDMPDACADFGCAIKSGVRKDFPIDGVF